MDRFPRNSFDPTSQPWAREVERQLRALSTQQTGDGTLRKNSAAGVSATLGKLSEQIAAINETQEQLQLVVDDLSTQQTELAAQQAQILALLNSQVEPVVASTITTSGWALSTTYETKAVTSIPVPVGYTRALVYGSGSISVANNDNTSWGANMFAYIDISGDGGSAQQCWISGASATTRGAATISPIHSRVMTGLAGGSLTVGIVGGLGSTTVDLDLQRAQVGGFAIFLR